MIQIALSQYGIKEIQGPERNNPEIMKYFEGLGDWVKTDETAWCSAYCNWVAIEAGRKFSGELHARSWLNVGEAIFNPKIGDVVVLWRVAKEDWRGHVGFFIREDEQHFWILGGNQSNQVCIKPYDKTRLLGFRRI